MTGANQSELITLFEDSQTNVKELELHDQNLKALRDIVGQNNFSLQTDGSLRIMHYVGFFQKGRTRVQILPKVYSKSSPANVEQEKGDAMDFVYRLLCWSGFLKGERLSSQEISASGTDLLELFIQFFLDEFLKLFSQRASRMYEERIESQTFIKGRILVADTIRTHPILRHRHVVRFDEFSVNNPLNQIFKSLLIQLVGRSNHPQNKKKISLAMTYLEDVEFVNLSGELFDRVRFSRLNTHFQPLFNLAKLFFYNEQPGLSHGRKKTMSFLVPINKLFQDFIAGILAGFSDSTYTFHHEANRVHLLSEGPGNRIQLRPDYTVTKGKEVIAIMDAKYKAALNARGGVDLKESDVYQLCTYAMRYGVKNLVLIYPKFHGTTHQDTLLANYTIDSGFGEVELRAIQVDVLEGDLAVLVDGLRNEVYPGIFKPS